MDFDIITIFPDMFDAISKEGIIARAIKKKQIEMQIWQLRDFSHNRYKNVDDEPYGGGGGMIMRAEPIRHCLSEIRKKRKPNFVIYLSPQGQRLAPPLLKRLLTKKNITLICGRYSGIDERIIENDIDLEVSIGDYVLSGGELAAMVLIDALARQIPGVLGNEKSLDDSFMNEILDHPHYTRPEMLDGDKVPEILLSGNEAEINAWRKKMALEKTQKNRPDLLRKKS